MNSLARAFLIMAVLYGVAGILLGLHMAISQNHGQMPTHAHINVIGWVSFFLFAVFYEVFAANISRVMGWIHFVIAQVSVAVMSVGLWLLYSGQPQYEPVAAAGAIGYSVSFLVFALNVLLAMRSR